MAQGAAAADHAADRDLDVVPLYVDPEPAVLDADKDAIGGSRAAKNVNKAALRQSISTGTALHPDAIPRRHRLRVDLGERISIGTYFNGFAASYWRRWTVVERGHASTSPSAAPGASVTVYRSMANGRSQRVDAAHHRDGRQHVRVRPLAGPVRRRWLVLVRRGRRRRRRRDRGGELDRRRTCRPGGARQCDCRHHHDEPPRLLRQAGRPDRRRRRRAAATSTRCS